MAESASIVVAGAGPVGMCAAIEAARRGIDVTVIEARAAGAPANAKCNTVPGCRMPHFWVAPKESVYDRLGPVYTLIRLDASVPVEALLAAADQARMPITLLDLPSRHGDPAFRHALLVVREDQHVVWRGDQIPNDPAALVARLCGRLGDARALEQAADGRTA